MDSILPTRPSPRHCETRRAADLGGFRSRLEQIRSGPNRFGWLDSIQMKRNCPLNNFCTTCRLFAMTEISRLPGPVMELWEWQYQGACRDADDTLFFHPEGERGSTRRRRAEAAKAICRSCPVMMQCREQSLRVREPYGVWGGLSEDERSAILAGKSVSA
jgi:WhiB family redox-sensing transcriptional regulator